MLTLHMLSPVMPYPPLSGGTAHIVRMIPQLAKAYSVDLAVIGDEVPKEPDWGPLAQHCRDLRYFARTPRSPLSADPPAVTRDYSAPLAKHLEAVWTQSPPSIVQMEFTSMAQYLGLAKMVDALTICTAHNVAFLAQRRRAQGEPDRAKRLRRWAGFVSLWLYELRMLRQCDLVITHSPADVEALKRWLPKLQVEHVPSGLDLDNWPVCFNPQALDEVLFVGNFLHPPNVEGALWLAQEVWPFVRQTHPTARLTLAGRDPSEAIRKLETHDIRVPGTVADLRPLYQRASVFAAPIFWGSGVRIKLLEALACGLPTVTTALAAEGIDLEQGRSALFAERPETFAAAIVQALKTPQLRKDLSSNARAIVERDYNWDMIGAKLLEIYDQALQRHFSLTTVVG